MPNFPTITARIMIAVLKKKGFLLDRTVGSHHIFRHPMTMRRASVPVHPGKDLGRGLTKKILKDADITPEEFLKLR